MLLVCMSCYQCTHPATHKGPVTDTTEAQRWRAQADSLSALEAYGAANRLSLQAATVFRKAGDWKQFLRCYACLMDTDSTWSPWQSLHEIREGIRSLPQDTTTVFCRGKLYAYSAYLLHVQGQFAAAAEAYEQSLLLLEPRDSAKNLVRTYYNLSDILYFTGDFQRSAWYGQRAVSLFQQAIPVDSNRLGRAWKALGMAYRSLGQPDSALTALHRAAICLGPDNQSVVNMLISKVWLEQLNKPDTALLYANLSLRNAEKNAVDDPDAKGALADALHQLGRCYLNKGQYAAARQYFNQALPLAIQGYGRAHGDCAKINYYLGEAFLAEARLPEALAAYHRTLAWMMPGLSEQDSLALPTDPQLSDDLWVLDALHGEGRVFAQQYRQQHRLSDLKQAFACYRLSALAVQRLRASYGPEASQWLLSDYTRVFYNQAVRMAWDLYQLTSDQTYLEKAFQFADLAKSPVVTKSWHERRQQDQQGIPDSLLKNCLHLRQMIVQLDQAGAHATATDGKAIAASRFELQRSLERAEQQLKMQYPRYATALQNFAPIEVSEIQKQLPDQTALLAYHRLGDTLLVFRIERQQITALPISGAPAIDSMIAVCYGALQQKDSVSAQAFRQVAYPLFEKLFEKTLSKSAATRLLVIPDGAMHYLPVEALYTQPFAGDWADEGAPFVIRRWSVGYAASASAWLLQSRWKPRAANGYWAGFGSNYRQSASSLAAENRGGPAGSGASLPPLDEADNEIRDIEKQLPGQSWLDTAATRANFLAQAPHFRLLHLALHGIIDPYNAGQYELCFSGSPGQPEATTLRSAEVAQLELASRMVVLSACHGADGMPRAGEGLMSLSRSFALAGCPTVVASRWQVSDLTTRQLMNAFYQFIQKGDPVDVAMQKARLAYLSESAAARACPYYWACFQSMGDQSPAPRTDGYWWLWVVLAGLGVGIVVWGWRRKINSK